MRFIPRLARFADGELSKFWADESFTYSGSSIAVLLIFLSSSKNDRFYEVGVFLLVGGTSKDYGSFFSSFTTSGISGKASGPRPSPLFDLFEEEDEEMLETRPSSVVW